MDWETIADIATTVGTFVALAGVITSVIINIRSERAAAMRAEAAARLADANSRRAVEALERIADRIPGGTNGLSVAAEPPVPRAAWAMRHQEGDLYVLENVGDATAHQTSIASAPGANLRFEPPAVTDVEPGGSVTFRAAQRLTTSDSTLTVSWQENGEARQWKYPLPPSSRPA
ncbi:hypothetical protein [Zhihengliuella salsuginis]|uniref:Uncharacterized protein n=1 Tax=Zhihengliuella salsuginis TaxID=578222 RepID=A0ABQ3GH79_9MICC|nr:hypothetical protein [Zhihengliuella salsuginis]GHD06255.1 hypothetical protein GCM10008096_16030 [Zhihengliuella salsuginis]